jgi:glycosyltransferase involved in cell wall biosynthesis
MVPVAGAAGTVSVAPTVAVEANAGLSLRPLLSVVVPVYNEEMAIGDLLRRLLGAGEIPLEILVVDDGSTDRSREIAEGLARQDSRIRLLRHPNNLGKGAAIRTALPHLRGGVVAIQDADLEYDPADLPRLVAAFADPAVEVVYGSRWLGRRRTPQRWSSYLASRLLSALTNVLYGSAITDEPTGYKLFRASVLRGLALECSGFDFCPEVTAKVLLLGCKIHEAPISYAPRTYAQGKKISWWDGVRAAWVLLKLRLRAGLVRRQARRGRLEALGAVGTRGSDIGTV